MDGGRGVVQHDRIPLTGFVRLSRIIGPGNPIPVSKSTWWDGVRSGRFPKPVKLGPRITAWRVEDIRRLIECAGQYNAGVETPLRTHAPRRHNASRRRSNTSDDSRQTDHDIPTGKSNAQNATGGTRS
jgi:prophage regulatory protein